MSDDDHSPISSRQAMSLFADWKKAPVLVLAVSGGPDSVAMMWLAARWRRSLVQGPRLVAVTVDHGLRAGSAREAREVKRLAQTLDVTHRTVRWTGAKPKSGVPAAARAARYRLLAKVAQQSGAGHILTAHTRDDQAETVLMRLLRGSGITGLAAMARHSEREGLVLARPFLGVSKSRLVATLKNAGVGFAEDQTNRDVRFTRPRLRQVIRTLAEEGGDARSLARLATRLSRANAAIEVLTDGAARYLALREHQAVRAPGNGTLFATATRFDARDFAGLPEEIRLRLLMRAVNRSGHEGPVELGKAEALLTVLDEALRKSSSKRPLRLKQTLSGALIHLNGDQIVVSPAPPRRHAAK